MATVYNVMLYGGLALAIVFAIVAVVLFFVLKIPKAVGIATGSTARKKIDEIKDLIDRQLAYNMSIAKEGL